MDKIQKPDGFESQYLFVLQQDYLAGLQSSPLFSPFYITDIGYFPHAQYHFRRRSGGCAEAILLMCVAGSGYCRVAGGPPVSLSAGQAFVLPPGQPHEYAASESAPWSVYWMHFAGESTAALCSLLAPGKPLQADHHSLRQAEEQFERCFALLKKPCQREELFAVCQHAKSALATLALAGKQAGLQLTEKADQAIQDATAYMKKNLHRSVTLGELAASANFSASHLNALFNNATGYAPIDYFLRMKMQAAGKELYFTTRPIKEIAAEFGIYDSCYFSRMFKKIMGMPPLEYRRQTKG